MQKNRECKTNIERDNYNEISEHSLLKCSKFKNIKLNKKIGEGTFGVVYIGTINKKFTNQVAIKIINTEIKIGNSGRGSDFNEVLNDLNEEIEFSYFMSDNKLGPVLYDSFYYSDKKDGYWFLWQVIIMEYFPSSVHDFLKDKKNSISDKTEAVKQMIQILKKQIFDLGVYCRDIKPKNFIIKKIVDKIRVKMIDFGDCSFEITKDFRIQKNELNMNDQIIFYIIHLVQLYMWVIHILYYDDNDDNDISTIVKPFFEDKFFKKLDSLILELYYNLIYYVLCKLSENKHDPFLNYAPFLLNLDDDIKMDSKYNYIYNKSAIEKIISKIKSLVNKYK